MKLNNLLKVNIREGISPKLDRKIQEIFFSTIFLIKDYYGFKYIEIQKLFSVLNQILKHYVEFPDFNIKDIYQIIEKRQEFLKLTVDIYSNNILEITDDFFLEDNIDEPLNEDILKICKDIFFSYTPHYLREKLNEYEKIIENLKQSYEIEYLLTTSLLKKKEISSKIVDLISRTKDFLFLSIAYYNPDLLFLTSLIAQKIKSLKEKGEIIDLKILYRPENDNKDLIIELRDKLNPLGYKNFFKSFDKNNLKERFKKKQEKMGYLHSKAIITDVGVLVGSANQTHLSLAYNFESAIYTNKPSIINKARLTFNEIWEMIKDPDFI